MARCGACIRRLRSSPWRCLCKPKGAHTQTHMTTHAHTHTVSHKHTQRETPTQKPNNTSHANPHFSTFVAAACARLVGSQCLSSTCLQNSSALTPGILHAMLMTRFVIHVQIQMPHVILKNHVAPKCGRFVFARMVFQPGGT